MQNYLNNLFNKHIIFGVLILIFGFTLIIIGLSGCGKTGDLTSTSGDTSELTVSDISPTDGTTSADVTTKVSVTFSKDIDSTTLTESTFTVSSEEKSVSGTIIYDTSTKTATFTPLTNFTYNTTYTVTITTKVKDSAKNKLAKSKNWSFTTKKNPDTTPPTVSSTSPADGATSIAVDTKVTVTFSEDMDSSTITTSTFTLSTGGSSVSGAVSYDASTKTATFTPSSNLSSITTYTATIKKEIKDSAGNKMENDKTWSFITKSLNLGATWTQATASAGFSPRRNLACVSFNNKMWVIGGWSTQNFDLRDVWYSTDGVNWTQATETASFTPGKSNSIVVFNDKIWLIGGSAADRNDVWYSSDGVNWTQTLASAPFTPRVNHTCVVFDNKIWVIGGYIPGAPITPLNDVWYSSDGVNWTQATSSADFTPRSSHSSVVFDNKMWVIGGHDTSGGAKGDVWYSTDGKNWIKATDTADFSSKKDHQSVVFDNKIWVIGGSEKDDVWYSTDAIKWTKATASAGFSARSAFSSIVFNNKIWVIGGYNGTNNSLKNDVWWSN